MHFISQKLTTFETSPEEQARTGAFIKGFNGTIFQPFTSRITDGYRDIDSVRRPALPNVAKRVSFVTAQIRRTLTFASPIACITL